MVTPTPSSPRNPANLASNSAAVNKVQVALRIVHSYLSPAKLERFEQASVALYSAKSSRKALLDEYGEATLELRREVEELAEGLAEPKRA